MDLLIALLACLLIVLAAVVLLGGCLLVGGTLVRLSTHLHAPSASERIEQREIRRLLHDTRPDE